MPHLPFATDPENPLVQSAKTALRREQELRHESSMTDAEIPLSVFPAWTDAGFMTSQTDMTCIILGPGQLGVAHSIHECIEIKQHAKAACWFTAITALHYCRIKNQKKILTLCLPQGL